MEPTREQWYQRRIAELEAQVRQRGERPGFPRRLLREGRTQPVVRSPFVHETRVLLITPSVRAFIPVRRDYYALC